MYRSNKKHIYAVLYTAVIFLAILVSSASTEIDPSRPFEQQPLYLESKKAMERQDYEEARKILLELCRTESQKTRFDMNYAVDFFKKAYESGDSESFALYLNALAKAGRFDELAAYHPDIFANAFYDRNMLETYCLITEHLNRKEEKQAFLTLARRVPIEIAKGNLTFLRLLTKYGESEDKLLLDFLNKYRCHSSKSENGKTQSYLLPPANKFYPPDKATVESYRNSDEYKQFIQFIKGHNLEYFYEAKKVISKLSVLAENPKYQILVNADLAYIALKESDLLRVEQLCEISIDVGDLMMVYPLFTSLIVQNKLNKAKKYEVQFLNYTFSNNPNINPDIKPAVFAKYCLLSGNKEMFLKWVRSVHWEVMLKDMGIKKLFLEGLERWGQSIDNLLINYLKTHPPKSDNEMDFDFVWGVPYNGTLFPIGNNRSQGKPQRVRQHEQKSGNAQ